MGADVIRMQGGGSPAGLDLGGRTGGLAWGSGSVQQQGCPSKHRAGKLWRQVLGVRGILDAQNSNE